ncbi:MAG: hypothetical protein HY320_14200 [Armatimonadetes bacterium]|nr:hypothetical protein [Armatimonadota bacterium]
MGRPPKPPGEKYISRQVRFPPALWAEVEESVPANERSAFIRRAVEWALRRIKRERSAAARSGETGEQAGPQ